MYKITVSEVGDVGIVRATGKLAEGLWIHNDVGGSCELPPGKYRVQVTKVWDDYETGRRCIGKLLDPADIETARKTGTLNHSAEDYAKYGEAHVQRVKKAKTAFDPSTVYFDGDQLEHEAKKLAPRKPKAAAPTAGYSLKGIKTFQGMDGVGLNATLMRDGKDVCTLIDEGCGGEMLFRWHDQMHGESKEMDLWDAFIAAEKAKMDATKKNEYGMTEKDYFDGAMWVNTRVDEIEAKKRIKRLCKANTCYQVDGEIGSDKFWKIKGTDAKVREWVQKKHPGQTIKFLNDEV
jgi:hypothetical protein